MLKVLNVHIKFSFIGYLVVKVDACPFWVFNWWCFVISISEFYCKKIVLVIERQSKIHEVRHTFIKHKVITKNETATLLHLTKVKESLFLCTNIGRKFSTKKNIGGKLKSQIQKHVNFLSFS
jgi:hypothetical protein